MIRRRFLSPVPSPSLPNPSSLAAVLAWHCDRYPLLRARDIYKLIHQGVFGPGHIVASAAGAKRMLEAEVAALKVRRFEPALEPLDPKNRLVRVNLRPLLGGGGSRGADIEWLIAALVESARRARGSPEQMRRRLAAAARWCRKNLPREAVELERMAARAEESGFPAFHHSPAYDKAYRPAYRVVLASCLDQGIRRSEKRNARCLSAEQFRHF